MQRPMEVSSVHCPGFSLKLILGPMYLGVGWGVGRFDFPKVCLIFAPGGSITLYCTLKDPSDHKVKNCLDAK